MKNIPISYLNSNDGSGLLAFGEGDKILTSSSNSIDELSNFVNSHSGSYIFGFLSYDLKNEIEKLTSLNHDGLNFPEVCFWIPKYVVKLRNEHFEFVQGEKNSESIAFLNYFLEEETDQNFHRYDFNFTPRISKEEYIEQVNKLKHHIQIGNIYEVNFCQEFYAENVSIEYPFDAYFKLNTITKAPFSCYFQMDDYSIFGGSPERFIKKEGTKLISEPIKGTSKRGLSENEDNELKQALISDPKERAENVMIVDLVRNDLSKIAKKNSVEVEELCQIYSFETVHQMISRISCEIESTTAFTDIIKATFPMGSMTGVPKIRAMELIEEHESFKRGVYSGSIGYIKPNGDFDFNVVIRSLLYNQKNNYLSCSVGGALTILSDPEKEYEECLVKVKRILDGMNE
jgi:para-aminobenzoate synthetase component 1